LSTTTILSPEKIEKGTLTFIGILTLVIFYFLVEGQFILRLIPIHTKGSTPLGKVEEIKGTVYRKLKSDSLHLPIQISDQIYFDDLITTGDQSSLEIQTFNNNSLSLEPNTILRLSQLNNKILLHLHSGTIVTHFIEDEILLLQIGTSIKDIQIRKGTFLIKNSTSGIQITAYTQNLNIKKSYELEEESRRSYKAEAGDEKSAATQAKDDGATANSTLTEFKMPISLPFPPNNQVFLITKDTKIKELSLVAKKACQNNCNFKLSCNGKTIFEKTFSVNETPYYSLQILSLSLCNDFQWNFKDGNDEFKNNFSIEVFSEETFNRYIEQNKTIEVL